jgi:hypothetical protein
MQLMTAAMLAETHPKAWAYLKSHEAALRGRENSKMDRDDRWWGYVYPKNLDKHEISKLIVPRLVQRLACFFDNGGDFYLDNVDVGGVIPANSIDSNYLLGLLNSELLSFIFRWISKPFQNGYYSANKQFLAPLPIALPATDIQQKIATFAKTLQGLHSRRADCLREIEARLGAVPTTGRRRSGEKPLQWLFPQLPTLDALEAQAPVRFSAAEKRDYAKLQFESVLAATLAPIQARLSAPAASLAATFTDGELRLLIDGMPVVRGIYVDDTDGAWLLAQWQRVAETFRGSDAAKLARALRQLVPGAAAALQTQVIARAHELQNLSGQIDSAEAALNALVLDIYALTPLERQLVETAAQRRWR